MKTHLHISNDVPAFTCLVYVSQTGRGVHARVANLDGIEFTADSEREALGKVIPQFKQTVAEALRKGQEIPWVEPVAPPMSNEQKRIVPVHL